MRIHTTCDWQSQVTSSIQRQDWLLSLQLLLFHELARLSKRVDGKRTVTVQEVITPQASALLALVVDFLQSTPSRLKGAAVRGDCV
jgi:hypothetical protein